MEKFDIKSLTTALKNSTSAPKEQPATTPSQEKTAAKKPQTLTELIKETNGRKDFNTEACVYIDSEIHEVLSQLKARTRLRIGNLISGLAEAFIKEHRDEIIRTLKTRSNRYTNPA
ncbi:MAG: hypothetical protein U5K79_15035 [Cyclobacteriaceae bacterium]|nr:hypothetical protein [Cyclobacteriaceae bacterium]